MAIVILGANWPRIPREDARRRVRVLQAGTRVCNVVVRNRGRIAIQAECHGEQQVHSAPKFIHRPRQIWREDTLYNSPICCREGQSTAAFCRSLVGFFIHISGMSLTVEQRYHDLR